MMGFDGYKFVDELTGRPPKKGSTTGGLPMGKARSFFAENTHFKT